MAQKTNEFVPLRYKYCKHIAKTKLNNVYFSLELSFGLLPSFANLRFYTRNEYKVGTVKHV